MSRFVPFGVPARHLYPSFARVLARVPAARPLNQAETAWRAPCPVHGGIQPDLCVSVLVGGQVLLHCEAGCRREAIARALGLTLADLMPAGGTRPEGRGPTDGQVPPPPEREAGDGGQEAVGGGGQGAKGTRPTAEGPRRDALATVALEPAKAGTNRAAEAAPTPGQAPVLPAASPSDNVALPLAGRENGDSQSDDASLPGAVPAIGNPQSGVCQDGEPVLHCLADVAPQAVPWLWPERVALGRITVLVGRPGAGKSFLALDLAARVTAGAPWPDGGCSPRGPCS